MDLAFGDTRETATHTVLAADFDTCIWGIDAHEAWEALRAGGPVVHPGANVAVATSTGAVEHALHHPEVFSSNPDAMYFGSESGAIPLQVDPPDHSNYRKMLDPLFTPRKMAAREADVTASVNALIDGFIERGSCDFSTEFAVPFPSSVFLQLMGLPYEQLDDFLEAKEGMIRPRGDTEEERLAAQMRTSAWIFEYFTTALDTHAGTDDVLGHFLTLEGDGRLTRDETLNICLLMLAAGLDTVTDTLECAFAFLAESPSHQRELVERPDLAAAAVEELMRYDTPVPAVSRIAMEDTALDGCPVHAGELVRVLLPVYNLDPELFPDPGTVDFARESNKHIAFGAGVHRCLGSHLARLELRIVVREWHRRIPEYRLADGHNLVYRQSLREIEHLPLEFPPGPREG